MKFLQLLFLVLVGFSTNHDYTYDYRLEYELISNQSGNVSIRNYYVNKNSNDYYAQISKSKKSGYDFYFRDQDKFTIQANITGDYKNPGTVIMNNSLTRKFIYSYEYKAKNYEIINLKDTLINDKLYAQVKFKMINQKKAKRRKAGTHIYIIDTSVDTKPLLTDPTILNIYRRSANMPNGLIKEKIVYDSKGVLIYKEKLKEFSPVNFKLIVKEN
jgi:hypothetical protein